MIRTDAAAVLAGGILGAAAVTAAPAAAWPDTPWTASTAKVVNGNHVIQAQATFDDLPAGLLDVDNVRSAESTPLWDTICAWQGYVAEVHEGVGTVFDEYSGFHGGCSFVLAVVQWEGWVFAMPETAVLRAKWRSDATPQGAWTLIGDIDP